MKWSQSFTEIEILRKFHEIYKFHGIYDVSMQRSTRAHAVPRAGWWESFKVWVYRLYKYQKHKIYVKCMGASQLYLSVLS